MGEHELLGLYLASISTGSIWLEANSTELISDRGGAGQGAGQGLRPPPELLLGETHSVAPPVFGPGCKKRCDFHGRGVGALLPSTDVFSVTLGSTGRMRQNYRNMLPKEKSCVRVLFAGGREVQIFVGKPGTGSLGAEGMEKVARNLLHPQVKPWVVGCL